MGYVATNNHKYSFIHKMVDRIKAAFSDVCKLHLTSCIIHSGMQVLYICKNMTSFNTVHQKSKNTRDNRYIEILLQFLGQYKSTL